MNSDRLQRLVLVRHGETTGQSSIRYFGATDVPLSALGREQIRLASEEIELGALESVWASSLSRAWQAASILAPGRSIRLEGGFREIDFGRWEGWTREEIEARDPELYARWQADPASFEFPEGESRAELLERVDRGLERLLASGTDSALVVVHKGVVRALAERVAGIVLDPQDPDLAGVVQLFRDRQGTWQRGRRGSDGTCSIR